MASLLKSVKDGLGDKKSYVHKDAKVEHIDPIGHLTLTIADAALEENDFDGFHIPQRVRMMVILDGVDINGAYRVNFNSSCAIPIKTFKPTLDFKLEREWQNEWEAHLTKETVTIFSLPIRDWMKEGDGVLHSISKFEMKSRKTKGGKSGFLNYAYCYKPVPNPYQLLHELLLKEDAALLRTLLGGVDGVSQPLARFYVYCGKPLELVQVVVTHELSTVSNPVQLFRGVTLPSQTFTEFMNIYGRQFLQNLLYPLLKPICQKPPDVELDPVRWAEPKESKEVQKTEKRLIELVQTFLKAIAGSVSTLPPALREALAIVGDSVEKKFPGQSHVALSGVLFLRFLCPAIVSPDNLFPDLEFTPQIRRCLILVAKVMQNLMNGVEFGEKEAFLSPMNVILTKEKNYAVDLRKKLNDHKKAKEYDPEALARRIPAAVYEALMSHCTKHHLLSAAVEAEVRARVEEEAERQRRESVSKSAPSTPNKMLSPSASSPALRNIPADGTSPSPSAPTTPHGHLMVSAPTSPYQMNAMDAASVDERSQKSQNEEKP